ncbi:Endo-beta-1,6-galactanase [Orchesella cincta]|uniref:Endo-beta-1,6-galactanase n=1 Tax=Orchesella cincta TaxID=48709 RepID=A0A1D2MX27_ORCCI|nr:Endo-beta-1,6-galactanase [Orchesella cincta]
MNSLVQDDLKWIGMLYSVRLTISGCSKGNSRNPPLHSNFDAVNSAAFADYATEVIKYFHENLNITFTSYAPFNEPFGLHGIGSWAGNLSQQEGCNMDRPTMVSIIQSVHEAIEAKNMSFLKIAISDETQVNTQLQSYDYFVDAGVSDLFGQVNVHGYWDQVELSRKDLLSMRCSKAGHGLWMDEMGWGGTPVENMEQGLNIANRIVVDLRKMLPSAWVYWQVVEGGGGWGLLEVPYVNTTVDIIKYNSGYYAMEQFSQHIKQGSKLIYISNENSIAALDLVTQKLVIVVVNAEDSEVSQEFDLGLFESVGSLALFRTSPNEQHLNLPPPTISASNKVQVVSPPQSISTLEVSDVVLASGENLLQNGGFESVQDINGTSYPTAWTLQGGSNNGITSENSWRGEYSGVLDIRLGSTSALLQNITLASSKLLASCTLYLTAWCSSSQGGTKLGVKINAGEGPVVDINRNGAYSSYGVSFSASAGDIIEVYFENTGALLMGVARVDNVFLHAKCE